MSTLLSSIQPTDRTLSGAITSGHSGPGSDGNKRVLRIPQSSSIIGTSPSDCLVLYPGHLLVGGVLALLQRNSRCILQPQPNGQAQLCLALASCFGRTLKTETTTLEVDF